MEIFDKIDFLLVLYIIKNLNLIATERKDNVLSKKLIYAKKNGLTSTKIELEESYVGEEICYEYDEIGNIKNIEIEDEYGNIVNKDYTYDGLSRLKSSTINSFYWILKNTFIAYLRMGNIFLQNGRNEQF